MEAPPRLLDGVLLPLATTRKDGPPIDGTMLFKVAIIVLGLVGGAVCYFVLSTVVEPRPRRYLERKFGVNITVGQILKSWDVEGGSPATNFAVGLLWWPCTLVEAAGAIVPFFSCSSWRHRYE
jgi:hypothetical protein